MSGPTIGRIGARRPAPDAGASDGRHSVTSPSAVQHGSIGPRLALAVGNALAVAWLALTAFSLVGTLPGTARAGYADFFTFLGSAEQWRAGHSIYDWVRLVPGANGPVPAHPNLNHPATALLLAPFTLLSGRDAFLLWTALGLVAYLLAVALAARELRLALRWRHVPVALALVLTAPGVVYSLQLGQFGLPLALPVVGAWLLLRRGRPVWAGAILGVLVALKPFLALVPLLFLTYSTMRDGDDSRQSPVGTHHSSFVLRTSYFVLRRCRWPGLLATAAGALGVSLAALPFVGVGAYREWLATMGGVTWYDHGLNVSLTGLLYRVVPPAPPGALTWAPTVLAAAAGLLALTRPAPPGLRRLDRDAGLLLVLAILGSPLGWLYYTPLLIVPLVALAAAWPRLSRARRAGFVVACALLWTPHILLAALPGGLWAELTVRATATYGLIALALVLGVAARRTGAADAARPSLA